MTDDQRDGADDQRDGAGDPADGGGDAPDEPTATPGDRPETPADATDAAEGPRGEAAGGAGPGTADQLPSSLQTIGELADRAAAGAGFVVAAFALVAAMLPWTESPPFVPAVGGAGSTVGAVLAAVATAAFFARRHGLVDRRPGAAVAGAASAGVVLTATARFLAPAAGGGSDPVVRAGLPLALVAGSLAVALAIADERGVSFPWLVERARRTAVGFGLVVGAFVALFVLAQPLRGADLGPVVAIVVVVVLTDVVFALVALAFLVTTGRGLEFVDLSMPGVRDLAYSGAGIVGLFAVLVALRLVTFALDLPSTSNNITRAAREGHPETLLVLVPLSFLLVAPAEELLNRNVIDVANELGVNQEIFQS
jgi:hypothetical protein